MRVKRYLLGFMLVLLAFPAVQKTFAPIRSKPLSGVFPSTPKPALSLASWMNGSFQEQFRKHIEDSVGFRPDFVRLYNQLDFSLFSLAHAERVVVGKNDELFATEYIIGYFGQNFPGRRFIDEKLRMLKFIQDYLWKEEGIFVAVVIPPDKGSLYPEYIPDRYMKMQRHEIGREYFTKRAGETGVNVLDFNPYFSAMRDVAPYRMIPVTGVHWSDYGAFLAADSALRYLEKNSGFRMPKLVLDSVETSLEPRHKDDDINQTMNLAWDAPHVKLGYPCFHVEHDTSVPKPSALFVADSFIWGWWDQPVIQSVFRNQEIWYYDKEVFPETFTKLKSTSEINLREAIERQDFVILLQVGAGTGDPGAGIIDRLYAEYDTSGNNAIRRIERKIMSDPAWLALEEKKALENNIPLASVLRMDAISLFNAEIRKK